MSFGLRNRSNHPRFRIPIGIEARGVNPNPSQSLSRRYAISCPVMQTKPSPTFDQVVHTACSLDCPDSCSLAVTVNEGRVVKIDGSQENPTTAGFICDKVRRFGERIEGEARLRYPAVRVGLKGQAAFSRIGWD